MLFEFDAQVIACEKKDGFWQVVLDKTAFFPEGGGQPGDSGYISGVRVCDTRLRSGDIVHLCEKELPAGEVHCRIDGERRLRFMQNHTGEHILSGLAHSMYGCTNVGFHMGSRDVTVDFDIELDEGQLWTLEKAVNDAIARSLPVRSYYPEDLSAVEYRSKLELTENVRIVEIEGIDRCACCAPHLPLTSMVGVLSVLSFERWKGGVRLHILCGLDAHRHYAVIGRQISRISRSLSCEQSSCHDSVCVLLGENERLTKLVADTNKAHAHRLAENYPMQGVNICCRENTLDTVGARELANILAERYSGVCAVLFDGSDQSGYAYIIRSNSVPLRRFAKDINTVLSGRGGGNDRMLCGRAECTFECACDFFDGVRFDAE